MSQCALILRDRREVAADTMAFWFDTTSTGYTFKAGQNADFVFLDPPETDAEGNARTFSFASSPHDKRSLMVATRMRKTAFKNSLKAAPFGTRLMVSPAMGSFTLHKDISRPAVFLAGGIGITPIRSILEWATQEKLPHRLSLFYSNRKPEDAAFLGELEGWAKQNPRFTFIATITGPKTSSWPYEVGRINQEMFARHLPEIHGAMYYLSGPPAMVAGMREVLSQLGVSDDDVKTEEFAGY